MQTNKVTNLNRNQSLSRSAAKCNYHLLNNCARLTLRRETISNVESNLRKAIIDAQLWRQVFIFTRDTSSTNCANVTGEWCQVMIEPVSIAGCACGCELRVAHERASVTCNSIVEAEMSQTSANQLPLSGIWIPYFGIEDSCEHYGQNMRLQW